MRIVAANHADSLRRRSGEDTAEIQGVDTLSDDLRAHYGAEIDDVPSEILALAQRLDGLVSERAFVA